MGFELEGFESADPGLHRASPCAIWASCCAAWCTSAPCASRHLVLIWLHDGNLHFVEALSPLEFDLATALSRKNLLHVTPLLVPSGPMRRIAWCTSVSLRVTRSCAQMWLCDSNLHFAMALAPFEFSFAALPPLSLKLEGQAYHKAKPEHGITEEKAMTTTGFEQYQKIFEQLRFQGWDFLIHPPDKGVQVGIRHKVINWYYMRDEYAATDTTNYDEKSFITFVFQLAGGEPDIEGVHPKIPYRTTMPLLPSTSKELPAKPAPQGANSSTIALTPTPVSPNGTTSTSKAPSGIVHLTHENFSSIVV
ncbi:hypothetical protein HAX54_050993 [Datura stramonium]|uniref:Uncharacterized protein n=1 Tax=Datura stramonium TaxID=4076 RepID=A0ABS8RHF4_DATST|nr:hypothetical protein [Datura stramonium]